MKAVTADQMRAIEQASEQAGVSTDALMETAGLAVARLAREMLGGAAGQRIVVLVGPGNNGADGLVAARRLRSWGAEVSCYLVRPRPTDDPKLELASRHGVELVRGYEEGDVSSLERLLAWSRLVIDAVLGTGRARPLEGLVKESMLQLGRARKFAGRPRLLALDLPTGLDADTGEADPACPCADVTAALGYPKIGMLRRSGPETVGEIRVQDIGLPSGLPEEERVGLELLTKPWVSGRLPPRPLDSHKGTYGHALIVAGSRSYVGAAYLSSQASVRSGAGLTTLASPESVYPMVAAKGVEAIHLPLPEAQGRVNGEAADTIKAQEGRRFTAVAIGCGLGTSSSTLEFMERLILSPDSSPAPDAPVLVDADGLNNLARLGDWPRRVRNPMLLTPHPGEMATLTGLTARDVQGDREGTAKEWAERWNACVVLKGAHTVVAAPGKAVQIAPFANPGLATGGTGDVLTGVIAGLLAQGLAPFDAACCGVYVHGAAGQAVTAGIGQTGLAASDLLPQIPRAILSLRP